MSITLKRLVTLAVLMLWPLPLAQAQEDMKILTGASFEKPGLAWFDPKSCAAPSGDIIHVNIGLSTLKLPAPLFSGGPVGKINRMGSDAKGNTTWLFPRNIGCPEQPASFKHFTLSPVPQLEAKTILIESSSAEQKVLDLQLVSWRDTGKCRLINSQIYACEGIRTDFGAKSKVAYLMAADPKITGFSGAPLRARCFFPTEKPVCNIVENIDGGLQVTLEIVGQLGLGPMILTHRQAVTFVDSLRVKSN